MRHLSLRKTQATETKSILRLTIIETIGISTRFVGCYAAVRKCRLCSKSIYIYSSLHEINTRYKEKHWGTTISSDEKLDVTKWIERSEQIVHKV